VELSVRLVTRPRPGIRTKVLVLVIIIVTVLMVWSTGQEPVTAISLVLGAGLAGAQVARALIAGGSSAPPGRESRPASLNS
jgi:hypothetical protein